ncbi:MAG TPA: peptidyl-prolyl cis-trans isomerase [Candidatus Anaerostipes avistercoris]|uniref:Peptidyl-prolyl cis-trans isomerase n=1 Tax=Candidatus Anaerostipes avistercoris TaxID=2838462 RepID=A0A9D2TA63_9FIRM|nr:peptidylprolyl isomerase [uncultured Anaerostipes sp.]HJC50715.1 peptidyl-prolyl cis-trans isomerase [Candidatus Anaerostipes avistercoris]
MKKTAKKLLCLAAVLALSVSLLTGCQDKNERTLFEYAGQEVKFQEAHIYARIMQYQTEAQYGAYFGENMWDMQAGTDSSGNTITMEESVKDGVINQLKQVKVLTAHADDYNVKLTKDETSELEKNVDSLVETDIGKQVMEDTEADKDAIMNLYREITLANKVMQAIIDDADVSVSDEEAKTTTVYKLVFTTKTTDSKTGKEKDMSDSEKKDQRTKAQSALSALRSGEGAGSVAKKFGVGDVSGEESYTKGKSELGDKFEKAAAKLQTNDISNIIETDDGYVIVKMINPNDTEAMATNKETLLQEKQQEAYQKVYEKWTKDADKEWDDEKSVNQSLWGEVEFKYEAATTASTTESDSSSDTTTEEGSQTATTTESSN